MERFMVLKIVDLCSFRWARSEVWAGSGVGGALGCLRLFYCIQIMDGLISGEKIARKRRGVSLSIQMCIVNERINDGNLKRLRSWIYCLRSWLLQAPSTALPLAAHQIIARNLSLFSANPGFIARRELFINEQAGVSRYSNKEMKFISRGKTFPGNHHVGEEEKLWFLGRFLMKALQRSWEFRRGTVVCKLVTKKISKTWQST